MKKEMKMVYETPWMECMQIEAEGTFAGSVVDDKGKGIEVEAGSQGYETIDATQQWEDESGNKHDNITWG